MKVSLQSIKQESPTVYTYSFQRPQNFTYFAGQYCYVELNAVKDDPRGPIRQFTLSSSPTESHILSFTTHLGTSEYKKALTRLAIGSSVRLDGPHGVLFFDQSQSGSHVFIAQDLGITPFRSIIKYLVDCKISVQVALLHIQQKQSVLFGNEISSWVKQLPDSKFLQISSENIYENMLVINRAFKDATYWIVGPNKMVTNTQHLLGRLKVKRDQIKTEKFTGY